ncbi:MAG: endonuclease/exonuclease/phosphatase family protein [Desulfobacterales bacterium]|jgi:endonuclease/exonuclease/phosphatase family metal-dependent hydrolase
MRERGIEGIGHSTDASAQRVLDTDRLMEDLDDKILLRVMTYNIHSCVGADGEADPGKITAIIADLDVDIAALQEVDAGHPAHAYRDQAQIIAAELGVRHLYFPVEQAGLRRFGLAVLSRFPIVAFDRLRLPNVYPLLNPRRRGALCSILATPAGRIHLINTHLSLFRLERRLQLNALMAGDGVPAGAADAPLIFCGDLNSGPSSAVHKQLSRRLTDVQATSLGGSAKATFHAKDPFFRLDHIFVSSHFTPLKTEVRRTAATAAASDHLPLVVELELKKSSGSAAFL